MNKDQKILSALSHLSAIFPLGFGFVGPLIIWLVKKDDQDMVSEHAKEALNFQLTLLILNIISFILMIVLIGFVMLWILGILNFILVIVATWKAFNGELFRYPFSIKFL